MNYRKYHLFALLLVLVGLLALGMPISAQDSRPDMGVALNPDVSGNIEFWHFWGSPVRRTAIRRIVAMCEQALPNIKVTETFKPFGDIWTANIAAVAAGSGMPDVIVEDRPQLPRIAADGIEQSLQKYIDRDKFDSSRFWPFTWQQTQYNGESYGIPFETDVRVLFYDKTLFEAAGLDPNKPPTTWDELMAAADKLDVKNSDGKYDRIGFFPLIGNVGPDVWAQTNGYSFVQDGKPNVNDPKVVETLNWIKTWVDRYGGWDAWNEFRAGLGAPPNDAFMSGKIAMVVDVAGYASQLNFYRPRVPGKDGKPVEMQWGVTQIPYKTTPSTSSGGFALSIPTGSPNADAAWEFIKCVSSPQGAISWARDTYAIPADQKAANDPVLMADPNWKFFVDGMKITKVDPFVPAYGNWKQELDKRYESVWNGQSAPNQALADAQKAIEDTMKSNGG
jgi:multiple sugar transport system substrate-binding protein